MRLRPSHRGPLSVVLAVAVLAATAALLLTGGVEAGPQRAGEEARPVRPQPAPVQDVRAQDVGPRVREDVVRERPRQDGPALEEREAAPQRTGPSRVQLSQPQVQLRRGAAVELSPEVVSDLRRVQAAPLLVRRDAGDRRTVLVAELESQRVRPLYRTRRDLVYDLSVSPGNRYTAALESTDGRLETRELGEVEYAEPPRNELVVLDSRGEVACRVPENVQRYSFSPDGDRLAYLVGSFYEGGVGFRPQGVFVLEIDGCRSRRVPASDVYEVAWNGSGRGAALHLRALARQPERRVLRYEPGTDRVRPAPHGAFHVSGDGRHFLKRPHELIEEGRCRPERQGEAECFAVFDARTGRRAERQPPADLGRPVGWAYGSGSLLAFVSDGGERRPVDRRLGRLSVKAWLPREGEGAQTRVWDAEQGRVVQRLAGLPLKTGSLRHWVASPGELLVRPPAPERDPGTSTLPSPVSPPQLQREVRQLRIALPPETVRRLESDGGR